MYQFSHMFLYFNKKKTLTPLKLVIFFLETFNISKYFQHFHYYFVLFCLFIIGDFPSREVNRQRCGVKNSFNLSQSSSHNIQINIPP